jgi:hypothetical protein
MPHLLSFEHFEHRILISPFRFVQAGTKGAHPECICRYDPEKNLIKSQIKTRRSATSCPLGLWFFVTDDLISMGPNIILAPLGQATAELT